MGNVPKNLIKNGSSKWKWGPMPRLQAPCKPCSGPINAFLPKKNQFCPISSSNEIAFSVIFALPKMNSVTLLSTTMPSTSARRLASP